MFVDKLKHGFRILDKEKVKISFLRKYKIKCNTLLIFILFLTDFYQLYRVTIWNKNALLKYENI